MAGRPFLPLRSGQGGARRASAAPALHRHLRQWSDQDGIVARKPARSMLGRGTPYAPIPYFWSDQYAFNLQYVGHASGQDEVVFRGSVAGEAWSAFYLRDGHLRGALAVNRPRERAAARQLIARQTPVTARQLADEGLDLRALVANPVA